MLAKNTKKKTQNEKLKGTEKKKTETEHTRKKKKNAKNTNIAILLFSSFLVLLLSFLSFVH